MSLASEQFRFRDRFFPERGRVLNIWVLASMVQCWTNCRTANRIGLSGYCANSDLSEQVHLEFIDFYSASTTCFPSLSGSENVLSVGFFTNNQWTCIWGAVWFGTGRLVSAKWSPAWKLWADLKNAKTRFVATRNAGCKSYLIQFISYIRRILRSAPLDTSSRDSLSSRQGGDLAVACINLLLNASHCFF